MKANDLRIVFMGTPDFAVTSLKTLITNKYNIVGVITAPDKPAGRGRKIQESAVKTYAKEEGLTILQPSNLKDETFLDSLKTLEANLQIVVAFRMLPKQVWQLPQYGTFNLHASLLPNYRGAAPINWAIINGETKTGVSTFFIDEKIDTGEMILQESVEITSEESAGHLHDKLMLVGSTLVLKTVKLIATNNLKTKPQIETSTLKTAHKLNKENCKINWRATPLTIYNKIRGLSPYPGAWCYLNTNGNKEAIKIYESKIVNESHHLNIGSIVTTKTEIKIAVNEGFISVLQIKLPGKRLMDPKTLLNGYKFDSVSIVS